MLLIPALSGCADLAYFKQAASGHLSLLWKARLLDDVLADAQTPERLRDQLATVKQIRHYASTELALPDNLSYTRYADTGQPYVVWNVLATQPLSLKLEPFCFPIVGCLSYKGFYREADARAAADQLRQQGLEVAVAGVPAYSTLGWTPDPVVNTFVFYPKGELARLIFHELAHQVLYIADDTAFNESFASAVEELGIERWLESHASDPIRIDYARFDARRRRFQALLHDTRAELQALYELDLPQDDKRLQRDRIFGALQSRYQAVRNTEWGGYGGYDRFFEQDVNGPRLAGHGLYRRWVPAFKALFERSGRDFGQFYAAAAALGQLPRSTREQRLAAMENPELADTVLLPDFIVREGAGRNDRNPVLWTGELRKVD